MEINTKKYLITKSILTNILTITPPYLPISFCLATPFLFLLCLLLYLLTVLMVSSL